MKKFLGLLVVSALSLAMLAGCSKESEEVTASKEVVLTEDDSKATGSKYVIVNRFDYFEDGSVRIKTEYEYDKHGNLVKRTEAFSAYGESPASTEITEWEYDKNGNKIKMIQYEEGKEKDMEVLYEYDENNRCIKETCIGSDGVSRYVNDYSYDENGKLINKDTNGEEANGTVHKDGHDFVYENGLLMKEVYMANEATVIAERVYTYDANSNLLTVELVSYDSSTPSAVEKEYTYDEAGRMLSATECEYNITTIYEYNEKGLLVKEQKADYEPTLYEYYDNGVRKREYSSHHEIAYDEFGNELKYSILNNDGTTWRIEREANYENIPVK